MATRIGVDLGGTFTDLIVYDDVSGEIRVAKEPTTPDSPEQGVLACVASGVDAEAVQASEYFLHGTTVGLNALLQRRGARVGLLATRGFRDVLEIRRGDRAEIFNPFWRKPEPLVPRWLRLAVTERVGADGTVLTPLDEDDVSAALLELQRQDVDAIAIAFMNAYANPDHERRAGEVLRESGFAGELSLSHEISREYREYERTSTTVIDAYVRPGTTRYLRSLRSGLTELGFRGRFLMTRSGGGAITFKETQDRPFETVMSGPVAGAEGAAEIARRMGLGDVVTADVGGTSFDTCLIHDGRPRLAYEGTVEGFPLQTSWVDVRSIGAGGGSIAHVDAGGLLRVGPQSAGSQPGPASYGRGGKLPTVTDAAFHLGMLGAGRLAAGVALSAELAEEALGSLARELDMPIGRVAQGIARISATSMAEAIREITIEQGRDPRAMTLMSYGGAGPLFATLLADELEIDEIVVPPYAGNFSAWGLLGADLTRTAARTRITRLEEGAVEALGEVLDELFATLDEGDDEPGERELALDVRYVGQDHTITVRVPSDGGRPTLSHTALEELFTSEYRRTFDHVMDERVEVVNVRATVRAPLPERRGWAPAAEVAPAGGERAEAWSFTESAELAFALVERASLPPGDRVAGPAVVSEATATTYVDAGFEAIVEPGGCMRITRTGGAR